MTRAQVVLTTVLLLLPFDWAHDEEGSRIIAWLFIVAALTRSAQMSW